MAFGDAPFLAVRILHALCWFASTVLTWRLFRDELGPIAAATAAVLVATSSAMLTQTTVLLSEMAFIPLVLICLVLAERWGRPGRLHLLEPVLGGALAAAAILVRAMGLALAPVMLISLLRRPGETLRSRAARATLFALSFLAPILGWNLRQSLYPSGYNYASIWTRPRSAEHTATTGAALQLERLKTFGPIRLADIKAGMFPSHLGWRAFHDTPGMIATFAVGGFFVLVGLVRLLVVRSPIDGWALATLFMLALWPWEEGMRLIAPMIPLFCGYLAWTGHFLFQKTRGRAWATGGLVLATCAVLAVQLVELRLTGLGLARQSAKARDRLAAMHRLADWQVASLPSDAAIACVTPPKHNAKMILAGGSYFARRVVRDYLEASTPVDVTLSPDHAPILFVHQSLVEGCPATADLAAIGRVDEFAVFTDPLPASRIMDWGKGSQTAAADGQSSPQP